MCPYVHLAPWHLSPQFKDKLCGTVGSAAACLGHPVEEGVELSTNWWVNSSGGEFAPMVLEDAGQTRQTQTYCEGVASFDIVWPQGGGCLS